MASRRGSLARGLTWPLRTGDVQEALGDSLQWVSLLWMNRPSAELLALRWSPVTEVVPHWADSPVVMWVHAVADDQVVTVNRLLTAQVLPEAALWITNAMQAPSEWQALRQARYWLLRGEAVVVRDHTQSRHLRQSR